MTRIHLSLQTRDLDATRAFYTALFGQEPDKVRANYVRFQPDSAPIALALMPGEPAKGPHHLGLKLQEPHETKAAWARLVEAGLEVRTEEAVTCCWSVQNKAWVSDPDGRPWEVYTVTEDEPAVERDEPTACCA